MTNQESTNILLTCCQHPLVPERALAKARAVNSVAGLITTILVGLGLALAQAQAQAQAPPSAATAPEAASGWSEKPEWRFSKFAVATAHPLASEAGALMLKEGGSAVDAAIASQMVLGLVEPQSSGLGGGAFLIHGNGREVHVYDGRETAPAATTQALFLHSSDPLTAQPMAFEEAKRGGRAVGVPGLIAMLHLAHQDHGRLPWKRLFEPAIELAEQGFPVGQRLHRLLLGDRLLREDPAARAYFYDQRLDPWPVGHRLRNPMLANVLRGLAAKGPDFFYTGEVAKAIENAVQKHASDPGRLGQNDLQNYKALRRSPLCFNWNLEAQVNNYQICGPPPPSSGPLAIGQILGILRHQERRSRYADSDHLYLEASRLAFADRALYVADPKYLSHESRQWESLLESSYLKARSQLITEKSLGLAPAGVPAGFPGEQLGGMPLQPEAGTTHLSIFDGSGNALALTSSIESAFGSRTMVKGFLLNNQLTDFSFKPLDEHGRPIANRPEPGKRPRSSMSPLLVLDSQTQEPLMAVGSAGGAMIIHYVAQSLLHTLRDGLRPQHALNQPHLGSLNGPSLLEAGRYPKAQADLLVGRGAELRFIPMTSGTQLVMRRGDELWGAADPRREGWVVGE